MSTWPWDDSEVRRATRDRHPNDDGWPSLLKAVERIAPLVPAAAVGVEGTQREVRMDDELTGCADDNSPLGKAIERLMTATDPDLPRIPMRGEGWWRYRAMIYFGVATLHFYRDEVLPLTSQQTLGDFADANHTVLHRICEEAIKYFGYELSHEQVGRVIRAWLADPCKLDAASRPDPNAGGDG